MSLLADISKNKFKSQASTRRRGSAFRDIGWARGLAGTCLGFRKNVLRVVGVVSFLLVFATIYNIYGVFSGGDAYASSITVSITDSSANLNLVAAEGGVAYGESDTASFSVSTTSSGGYTTTITGGNSDGKLTGTDSANYFSSISSAIASPSNFSNGTWGFKPSTYDSSSNTYYRPVATSGSAATIDVTNSAMTGNYTLAVAAKTDTSTVADTYSYNFIVAATTNAVDYDVVYTDYSFPERTIGSTTGSTITLSNKTPTRDGYTFIGWCTTPVSPGNACTGTTYAAGATYTLTSGVSNNITLYALWDLPSMQTFDCSTLSTGQTKVLKDNRDGSIYNIAKLTDGKCWMLDNLALGSSTESYSLNSSNTNLASGDTYLLSQSGGWYNTYAEGRIISDYKDIVPSDNISSSGGYKVGVYYNFCAASAGTICTTYNSSNSNYDICPKGWRLPKGGSSGEFQTLYNDSYYNTYASYRAALHLPLSGTFYNNSIHDQQGTIGHWWSATSYSNSSRYSLYIHSSSENVRPEYVDDRSFGLTIRCVNN